MPSPRMMSSRISLTPGIIVVIIIILLTVVLVLDLRTLPSRSVRAELVRIPTKLVVRVDFFLGVVIAVEIFSWKRGIKNVSG
jgi:hypothetical protein